MSTIRKSSSTLSKRTSPSFTGPHPHGPLTGERIAADLVAFGKAGGKIEVLGNTPLRGKTQAVKSTPTDQGGRAEPAATGSPPKKA